MPCIKDLVAKQATYCADVEQTVLDVACAMVERNIGAVPVLEAGRLVGIFSERDLMRRVVVEGRDPRQTRLRDVMTSDPLTVAPQEDTEQCRLLMHRHGFRHLPVCADTQLVGMISLRDILLRDLDERDEEVRMMRAYIHSTP
jgi:CBS domain-containing protein